MGNFVSPRVISVSPTGIPLTASHLPVQNKSNPSTVSKASFLKRVHDAVVDRVAERVRLGEDAAAARSNALAHLDSLGSRGKPAGEKAVRTLLSQKRLWDAAT